VHALAAVQSVKLIRNALAVCCVERGTVYSRLARRHEVAQLGRGLDPYTTSSPIAVVGEGALP
jgi:hypothetical protein